MDRLCQWYRFSMFYSCGKLNKIRKTAQVESDGGMSANELQILLEAVKSGATTVQSAAEKLAPVAELGYATLDLDRKERCGFPEVILAEGKTIEWVLGAVERMQRVGQDCFATRVSEAQAAALNEHFPLAEQDRLARTFWLPTPAWNSTGQGNVVIVTAGTGDIPVAREALVTARVMGANATMIVDVGVAGLHRLLRHTDTLSMADVVIVVAGMDGALPSVVGGLIAAPVIAVPTSIGYGAAFGGVAALLTMLNSCSAGVAVVNIDAGFKAGYIAARIVKKSLSNA